MTDLIIASDEKWMQVALDLAAQAALAGEVPVGAVVTCGDKIVGLGYNLKETALNPMGHAELIALKQASEKLGRWRLSDCTLYVTLEPCSMCAGALVSARLGRVVFATFDPKAGAVGSLYNIAQDVRLNHRVEVTSGVLADAASSVLKNFFQRRRLENKNA
jgi:tRNA(adenine34) deaminase